MTAAIGFQWSVVSDQWSIPDPGFRAAGSAAVKCPVLLCIDVDAGKEFRVGSRPGPDRHARKQHIDSNVLGGTRQWIREKSENTPSIAGGAIRPTNHTVLSFFGIRTEDMVYASSNPMSA